MDLLNCSFTILGIGRSGIASARLLKRNGINPEKIFLSDSNTRETLKYLNQNPSIENEFELEAGKHSERALQCDVMIKSPGIPPHAGIIREARERNIKIYSEIEIAYRFCKAPVIAITGTNGKTTTTILTGEIFKNAGFDTYICGNVGLAFSEIADKAGEGSVVVLELSSFQLYDIEMFKPAISILLNITEDHLDWHGSSNNYLDSKLKIFMNQDMKDITVFNYDDEVLRNGIAASATGGESIKAAFSITEDLSGFNFDRSAYRKNDKINYFEKSAYGGEGSIQEIMTVKEINIRGNHNLYNSLASIIAARAFDIKNELIRSTLMDFPGVEHRIEFVSEINGVKYFNDSKATNLDSLTVALNAFEEKVILILGGRDGGNKYEKVEKLIRNKVKEIIAIGESKDKIYKFFKGKVNVTKASSLEDAVTKSIGEGSPGEVVLFSPACKSFDMFENFEHRGKEFKRIVNLHSSNR